MLKDKLKRQFSKLTSLQDSKQGSPYQTTNLYGSKKVTQKNKCPKFHKKVYIDSINNSMQRKQTKQNKPPGRKQEQKCILVNQFIFTEESDGQEKDKKDKNKIKGKYKSSQKEGRKDQLQTEYLKILQKIYEDFNNQNFGIQLQQRMNKSIPETAKYFLGSVLQLAKGKNSKISYLKFIGECSLIFQKSAYNDIVQFIQIMKKFKNKKQQAKKQQVNTKQTQQSKQLKKQKKPLQQIDTNIKQSKLQNIIIQKQQNKALRRSKSGQIIQQSIVKTAQKRQNIENAQKNKENLKQFITQHRVDTFRQPESSLNIQIEKQSQKYSKKKKDKSQRNGYQTPILKITQPSPINKINQINKTIQKCLQKNSTRREQNSNKQAPQENNQMLNTSTNSIFNHITSNMKNINDALHRLTLPFTKQLHSIKTNDQYLSKPVASSSKTTRNVTPKSPINSIPSSHKFIQSINQKYRIDSKLPDNKYAINIGMKENYREVGSKSYTLDVKSNRNKKNPDQQLNGDRIDHLTNKVEQHIRKYAQKIQKTINARNLLT